MRLFRLSRIQLEFALVRCASGGLRNLCFSDFGNPILASAQLAEDQAITTCKTCTQTMHSAAGTEGAIGAIVEFESRAANQRHCRYRICLLTISNEQATATLNMAIARGPVGKSSTLYQHI